MQNIVNRVKNHLWPTVEFSSAYPLEDSVCRLRASEGTYSGVQVQVRVLPMDKDRYQFRIQARSGGLDRLNMHLTGQLQRQGDAATHVLIHPAAPNYLRLYLAAFLLVGLLIVAALNGGMMAVVIFGSAASASWFMNARKEDDLTRLVRQVLETH
jgi:hypothetical protein